MTQRIAFEPGDAAPDFVLQGDDNKPHKLSDFRGKKVILYFYPQDDTPGCTTQACDFRDRWPTVTEKNTLVVGISPDSIASHQAFKKKYNLPFLLLSDPDHKVATAYGAYGEKNLYGKVSMGIIRSTVLLDEQGKVTKHFRKVTAAGHADAVSALL